MKERIEMIVVALFSLFGAVVVFALVHEYLPSWVYYSCMGVFVIWFLYDVYKPVEEDDLHKKVQRLNDLIVLREHICKKYCSDDFIELKNKIDKEQERILKNIKL